ncbi:peptidylprolyl isomerase [uncultured Polaribacter sp.]|uniref:peptidylprolyl isomerase n=1 Tax=uncultured Polaribacter sp. TaxID=174711 RepID=UPI002625DB8E|nr:peptidylprolyl isomerase [uncultured Polaribacter sp.]
MKKVTYILLAVLLITSCRPAKYKKLKDGLYAEIETNKGDIFLELYFEDVPMTVANFASLAEGTNNKIIDSLKGKNFFEGIIFHRVVNDFVIQGGGFTPEGKKNIGYVFGDEFTKDKDGGLKYKHDNHGVLSMANGGPFTNSSQFFITHRAIPHLNGKHSVFGKTTINSEELKNLKTIYKDSLKLTKAIDSLRMDVVNRITQGDTIKTIKILKFGSKANNFNSGEVFDEEFTKFSLTAKEREIKEKQEEKVRYAKYLKDKEEFLIKMDEPKAIKKDSGLGVLMLKENSKGKKVVDNKPIQSHFTLYTADGNKIQSTLDNGGAPFVFQLNDAEKPMITGFKEGVKNLREGEKVRLFIPYYIGFGEAKFGPFPAKSDLVFEVEILKISD